MTLATQCLHAVTPRLNGIKAFAPPTSGIVAGHEGNTTVNLGNLFTVNTDMWVTSLGFYAQNSPNQTNLNTVISSNDETVTIYDQSGTAVASAIVSHSSDIIDGYYWQAISPVRLTPGTYTVSAHVRYNTWAFGGSPTTAPQITYTGHRYVYIDTPTYPEETYHASGDAYYGPNFTFTTHAPGSRNIVVSNDEWMFDDSYITTNDDLQFAKNLADFLAGPSGNILILSDDPRLIGNTPPVSGTVQHALIETLQSAGFTVSTMNSVPSNFDGYSAIFLGGAVNNSANLNSMLTDFVNAGGGVLVEGGTSWGLPGDGPIEANYWNPFLINFGLAFAPSYNGLGYDIDVHNFKTQSTTGVALFAGVDFIFMSSGNDVQLADANHPNPNVEIFSNFGHGLFGVYSNRAPANTIVPADPITLPATPDATFTGGNGPNNPIDTFITPYTAAEDGWIINWQTEFAAGTAPASLQLRIFRKTADGMQVVAESPAHDPRPTPALPQTTTFNDPPIPVHKGDYIGLTISADSSGHYVYPMVGPAGTVQVQRNVGMGDSINLTDPSTYFVAHPPALSFQLAPTSTANPLSLLNNYFVTGDYVARGVQTRGTGVNGVATTTITIPSRSQSADGVPDGADIVAAYLYWSVLQGSPSPAAGNATFRGYLISGQPIGKDLQYDDGSHSGLLRSYRADVLPYFDVSTGVRLAAGSHAITVADNGMSLPNTEGASLVVVWRVLGKNPNTQTFAFPLKSVVLYDGASVSNNPIVQSLRGFYDSAGPASLTAISSNSGNWITDTNSVSLPNSASEYETVLNGGNQQAWAGLVLSTLVNNHDDDGILDAWKHGPAVPDFHAGQPGYYDAKFGQWIPLPGAVLGQKDLFVQMDYMCTSVLSDGSCDPNGRSELPVPDAQGHDPLAMLQQVFANHGVALHMMIGNAIQEETCTDNLNVNPPQLCKYPGESGVVDWKISVDISKIWPRDPLACGSGGDCTPRFAYGAKDSYHYLLMANSLGIPAWNTRWNTLTSITVQSGVTTIKTSDRGTGINRCPSRITIAGALGNTALNGVYQTTACADSSTITISTPGVSNWTFPNSTLPEPVLSVTSGTITSISGFSDLGGADSVVSLGKWETSPNQDMSKRVSVQTGTILHELAHTLGLSHGGTYFDQAPGSYRPTFEANCKPNYQSVMNYMFQIDLLGPNHTLELSNQTLDTLSESAAGSITKLGISPATLPTFSTSSWYAPVPANSSINPAARHCDGTPLLPGELMYRVDAATQPLAWSNGQDINFDGQPNATMRGYDDWSNLDLRQVGATGGEFAALANLVSFGSIATPLNIEPGGSVEVGNGGTVTLGSGGNVTLGSGKSATLGSGGTITLGSGGNVTLGSGGTVTLGGAGTITPGSGGNITLGSGGTVTLGSGGNVTLGSGGTVTLGSGGTQTFGPGGTFLGAAGDQITVGVGGVITLGSGGTVALGSGGTVTLGSGGLVTLGSGGNVTLGSGGTVTLGSGGTITMGSGGTVTLGSGGNVTLGSGGTVTLGSAGNVTLGSGGNVTLGSGGTVTLGSGGNVTLGSGGVVTLGSGGNVTLGSGGTVTLGSGGTVVLGAGGTYAGSPGDSISLGAGGNITLGSGGTVTLGSGGNVTLGSGGVVTLGSGGNITLGSGGNITLGSGGNVTLGSGGTITLGSGGNVTLGSAGNVTLGSGGGTLDELTYDTANSIVRPPESPTKTSGTGQPIRVDWIAPPFGVVTQYIVYRQDCGTDPTCTGVQPHVIGTVTGNPPLTSFLDTNPPAGIVVYTISTQVTDTVNNVPTTREGPPSEPAVVKTDQTINFAPIPNKTFTGSQTTFTVSATASPSSLPVTFAGTGDGCTLSGSTVTIVALGSCTVTASQAGDGTYKPAAPVSQTFQITPSTSAPYQAITFGALPNKTYGNADFALNATASSNLAVTYSVGGACSIAGNMLHLTGAGLCSVTANQGGNPPTWNAATPVSQSFTVAPASATINITPYNVPYDGLPHQSQVSVTGVNGENLASSLTFNSAHTSVGNYSDAWSFAGTSNYIPAIGTVNNVIRRATTTISINNIPSLAVYGTSFTPTYAYIGDGVKSTSAAGACTLSGAIVNFTGIGTCTLTAHATAGTNYAAADGNPQAFTVIATPAIGKAFSPSTTTVNGVVTLSFTLTNTNAFGLTAVGFTDSLPSGLQLAAAPASTNTCGGTLSAVGGSTAIALVNSTIAANKTCTISVKVQAVSTGTKVNTTGAISSREAGIGNTATASVVVNKTTSAISSSLQQTTSGSTVKLTMSLTISSLVSGPVKPGGVVKVVDLFTNTTLASLTLDANGKASFTLEKRKPLDLKIQSTYQGDSNFLTSTSGIQSISLH